MEKETRDQSEFNMAVSYLNRLNNLFYTADSASIGLDMYLWFNSLRVLFRELSTEMKKEEIAAHKININEINVLLSRHLQLAKLGRGTISNELYERLDTLEMFLRNVMKESGLQTKIMDEAAKALR